MGQDFESLLILAKTNLGQEVEMFVVVGSYYFLLWRVPRGDMQRAFEPSKYPNVF